MQIAVDDRRRRPDVFAFAAGDLMRQNDRNRAEQVRRIFLQEDFLNAQFVRRIDDAVDESDDDDLGAEIDQVTDLPAHVVLVEAHDQLAGEIDPLAHAADHMRLDQRIRALRVGHILLAEIVQALAVTAGARQGHGRLVAGGDQHSDLRALMLDQRIGAERGGVTHGIDLGENVVQVDAERIAGFAERLVEAHGEIVMRRERLGLDVFLVPDDEAVGERATDIDGNAFHMTSRRVLCRGDTPPAWDGVRRVKEEDR